MAKLKWLNIFLRNKRDKLKFSIKIIWGKKVFIANCLESPSNVGCFQIVLLFLTHQMVIVLGALLLRGRGFDTEWLTTDLKCLICNWAVPQHYSLYFIFKHLMWEKLKWMYLKMIVLPLESKMLTAFRFKNTLDGCASSLVLLFLLFFYFIGPSFDSQAPAFERGFICHAIPLGFTLM